MISIKSSAAFNPEKINQLKAMSTIDESFLKVWAESKQEREKYFKKSSLSVIFDEIKPLATMEGLILVMNFEMEINYLIN